MFSNVHLRNHKYYIIGAKGCWCTVSESPTPISFLDLSVAHKINLMARSLILTHSLRVATVALSARGLVWQRCGTTLCSSRNSAIADKPRDAFRGQSRLPRSPWDIRFQICRNLENRVRALPRSLKMSPFDRAHNDFLLKFHGNHRPISYRFRDRRRFQSKIAKFSHPCILHPAEWFPLKLGTGAGGWKY